MHYIANEELFKELEEAIKEDGNDAAWLCLFDDEFNRRVDFPTLEGLDRIEHIEGKRIEFHDIGIVKNGDDGGQRDCSFAICSGRKGTYINRYKLEKKTGK